MKRATQAMTVILLLVGAGCQAPETDLRLTSAIRTPVLNVAPTAVGAPAAAPATHTEGAVAQTPVSATDAHPRQATWPAPAAIVPVSTPLLPQTPQIDGPGQPAAVVQPRVAATPGPRIVPDTVIATLTVDADEAALLADPAAKGFARLDGLTLGSLRVLSMRIPAGLGVAAAIARLAAIPGVARVTENVLRRRSGYAFTHVDTRYSEQWSHRANRANTEAAWSVVPAASQSKIIAAVLDTGLDVTHPEFAGRIQGAANFTGAGTTPDTMVIDDVGHGTHVTGILAAAGDNGVGVAGVAWGVQILPVKVLDKDGSGSDFQILKGFAYATQYVPKPDTGARVRVINLSLGSDGGRVSQLWTDAVAAASALGIVVVAASGNDGREVVGNPANTPGVLAVGSTGNYVAWESVSPFSNYGDRLDLTAPGEGILSTAPVLGSEIGAMYGYASGTSMASPFVAGVAALVMARYDATNAQTNAGFAARVRQRLLRAVDDLGSPGQDPLYGAGRINAAKAVAPATLDQAP